MVRRRYTDGDFSFLLKIERIHYWYKTREILISYIFEHLIRQKVCQTIILDIGAGNGSAGRMLSKYGNYLAYEYARVGAGNCAKEGYRVIRGDAEYLSLKTGSMDVVCMLDCLEHVQNDRLALGEVRRVLRDGGKMVLFVPAYKFLWSSFDDFSFHYRRYSKKELGVLIQGADLKVVKSFYVFSFLFPVVLVTSLCERIFKFQMKRESWIRKLEPPPKWVNSILVMLGSWEIRMGKFIRLPFGTTYVVIAEK